MVYKDKTLWRVSIPLPNVDGVGKLSILVYKHKTYGDMTGKELVDEYGGEKVKLPKSI